MQCLVVGELIDGGGVLQVFLDDFAAPMRPVVALEYNIGLVGELALGLEDVVAPTLGVAYLGTAQGIEIVQGTSAVLGHP